MKKSIVVPILFFALCTRAQEFESKPDLSKLYPKPLVSKIEFLVGPSIIYPYGGTWLKDIRVAKLGLSAGVGLIHVINSRWAINLKCGFENKGNKLILYNDFDPRYNPPANTKGTMDFTLNYLTVSILPKYYAFKNRKIYLGFGPYIGYLKKVKIYTDASINGVLVGRSSWSPDPHLDYKETDIGVVSMVGHDININQKIECSIQFISSLGLKDVTKAGTYPLRNTTYTIQLGFSINKNSPLEP